MSAAFRDGLRKVIIGLVHLWYFSDRASKADNGNWMQMLIYPADLNVKSLTNDGRTARIVVTIELEHYTP